MRALDRKLLRDLSRMRGQVLTIALVLAAGVAATVGLTGTYHALERARDTYYAQLGFPELFVHAERVPEPIAARLAAIPGVAAVEPRLAEPISVQVPGALRPAVGQAFSLPTSTLPALRGLVLRRGRAPDPAHPDEVLLLASFADAHGLEPGDSLDVVLASRRQRLMIAGVVMSPEHVFPVAGGVVNPRGVAVLWMPRPALAARTGKHGVFDDATFTLGRGASAAAVIAAIDRELTAWGGRGARDRDQQPSHRFVSGEIAQLEVMATRIPVVFLLVAAFLINVVLGRLVRLQREQLALLRAIGYRRWTLARHIAAFAGVVVALGGALGVAGGHYFGSALTRLYLRFFHFPTLEFQLEPELAALAIAVCAAAAAAGSLAAMRQALALVPAEAMRPPAPTRYRRSVLSRLGLTRLTGPMGRMIVRELERRPVATAISVAGIAFAAGIVVLGRFSQDSVNALLDTSLMRMMREDVTVVLGRTAPRGELRWFQHAPGVLAAEPLLAVPVRISHGPVHRDLSLTGVPRGARLRQILDGRGAPVPIPADGLLLSEVLARRLGVSPGDAVEVERKDGDHRRLVLPVAALVDDFFGINAYLELDAMAAALHQEPGFSLALLQVDHQQRDALIRALNDVPAVVEIIETASFRDAFAAQSGESMLFFTLLVSLLGAVIAVGVVYNNARVALSERSRDLATLRVLGYRRAEVAVVLLGQLAVQVLLAVPIGLVLGASMAAALMATIDAEQHRFAVVIEPATYGFASLVVLGAALATALITRRRLDRLDLIGALKARD